MAQSDKWGLSRAWRCFDWDIWVKTLDTSFEIMRWENKNTSHVHYVPSVSLSVTWLLVTCHLPAQLFLVGSLTALVDEGGIFCSTSARLSEVFQSSYLPWRPVYISRSIAVSPCQFVWQLFAWSCPHAANCKPASLSSKLPLNLLHSASQANRSSCSLLFLKELPSMEHSFITVKAKDK